MTVDFELIRGSLGSIDSDQLRLILALPGACGVLIRFANRSDSGHHQPLAK